MRSLGAIDYFKIATTALMVALGGLIVARSAMRGAPVGGYVMGLAFLGYGLYRGKLILAALRGREGTR